MMPMVIALILLGVLSRLVPHPPNVTPLTAIALFGAAYLPKRWAIALPLVIVGISDLFLGGDWTLAFNWAAFVLVALIGLWLRPRPTPGRIAGAALLGSLIFFFVTNAGVWLGSGMYAHSWAGLRECFVAAIPFFRNTLAGDAVYTAAFFAGYAVMRARLARQPSSP